MNFASWLVWGFLATMVLTTLISASQALGITRMNLPYLLGTMFTPRRDRAVLAGFLVHMLNGWFFSLLYVLGFEQLHRATWWIGALFGLLHASVVLTVGMRALPGLHPRMASEQQGPTALRQLEPPGFLALHYGFQTPASVLLGHAIFGAILGAMYAVR